MEQGQRERAVYVCVEFLSGFTTALSNVPDSEMTPDSLHGSGVFVVVVT